MAQLKANSTDGGNIIIHEETTTYKKLDDLDDIIIATGGELLHTIYNPTGEESAYFGSGCGIYENKAIVGAWFEDNPTANEGQSYIFDVVSGDLLHTLVNPTAEESSNFGVSGSIQGDYCVVGANNEDIGVNTNTGQAYVFNVNTGALVSTLVNPGGLTNDYFGYSVAIHGSNVAVGAYGDDGSGNVAGRAYIFDVITGNLLHTLTLPVAKEECYFGKVGINEDYCIVGAFYEDVDLAEDGAAHLYNVNTGAFVRSFKAPISSLYGHFGTSTSISGKYVCIGAEDDDTFAPNAGAVYIFDVTDGSLVSTLINPTGVDDYFGRVSSIFGNYAIVGAMTANKVYVFDIRDGSLIRTLSGTGYFGGYASLYDNSCIIGSYNYDIPTYNTGAAFIYTINEVTKLDQLINLV